MGSWMSIIIGNGFVHCLIFVAFQVSNSPGRFSSLWLYPLLFVWRHWSSATSVSKDVNVLRAKLPPNWKEESVDVKNTADRNDSPQCTFPTTVGILRHHNMCAVSVRVETPPVVSITVLLLCLVRINGTSRLLPIRKIRKGVCLAAV